MVIDIPQVSFQLPAGAGHRGRGLIKAFRYGLVMPGGSRIVFDLTGPAEDRQFLCAAKPPTASRRGWCWSRAGRSHQLRAVARGRERGRAAARDRRCASAAVRRACSHSARPARTDPRPVVVIDPGHGGIDNGTQAGGENREKNLVLRFGLALRDRIEKSGKYRVVMTRTDDTFVPLDRPRASRAQPIGGAVCFDPRRRPAAPARAMPRAPPSTRCPTRPPTPRPNGSRKRKTRPTPIGGVNLTEEPTDVADILIDLAQRETRTFSNRFARLLMGEMKNDGADAQAPAEISGLPRAEKPPDVPSVLVGTRLCLNKGRPRTSGVGELGAPDTVGSMAQAVDAFLAKRLAAAAGPTN